MLPGACAACCMDPALSGQGGFSCGWATCCSAQTLAVSRLPLQPYSLYSHAHSPPCYLPWNSPFSQKAWSFLPPGLCIGHSLSSDAHPILYLEDARYSSALCSSYPEASRPQQAVSCSLVGTHNTLLGILLFMQSSTYH